MNQETTILWEKFNKETDVQKILNSHGWTQCRVRGDRIDYARPGKSARDGISGNFHTGKRLFYVFTDATDFEPDRAYNAAQVVATLEFGGDMGKVARYLIDNGFCTPCDLKITGKVRLEI